MEEQFAVHLTDVFDGTADFTSHNTPLFFDNTSSTVHVPLLLTEGREWMAP
jgi:hypothetical protein